MEVWKAIYNSYSENKLPISPLGGGENRSVIEEFVDTLNPTSEQKERFEQLFGEFLCGIEMRVFYAGFKLAQRLDRE